ncbi:MFS transporter [Brevibacterium sp. 2SA]|uniref:MFS transporter n=1 Tax=Brevibacterium sp. 2SA TaxID=2502198 RepID=UPI001485C14E|nr:MFS transporter [Brevibacterium sp. 2SA]
MTTELLLSPSAVTWVMAGYVLAAGSLMIAGGRIAQAVGYTHAMTLGLVLFGLASAVGGAAGEGWVLIAARVAQGVGAALMTPAAMARLSAAFPDEDRERAYGIFGMIMGSGTAIGLLLGGTLTQFLSWRACMYVNVLFVLVSLIVSFVARDHGVREPTHGRGWWRGVILACGAGLVIQAVTQAGSPLEVALFGTFGVIVLGGFFGLDRNSASPLVPFSLFRNPARRAAYLGLFLWGVATITTFVSASTALQHKHSLDPLIAGVLFLVYPIAIQVGLFLTRCLGTRTEVVHIGVGLAVIGAGQVVYALSEDGLATLIITLALMGVGTSQVMPHANSAMNRDAGTHAGVAGGVGTTLQQLGGSVGLALPVAFATVTAHTTNFAAGITALTLVIGAAVVLWPSKRTTNATKSQETKEQHA